MPEPAKKMAASRPDSFRRPADHLSPSFSDSAPTKPVRKNRPEMGPANGFPQKGPSHLFWGTILPRLAPD
jgi:hypothetical protein